jgi:hypothetical protein
VNLALLAFVVLILVATAVALIGAFKIEQHQLFWLPRDMSQIILAAMFSVFAALAAVVKIPGGAWVSLLCLGGFLVWLFTQVTFGALGLREYAFVMSGTSLLDIWHHDEGARYVALKSTKIIRSTLGFQAAGFPANDPVTAISGDGIELKIEIGLAYFIVPVIPDIELAEGQTEPTEEQLVAQELRRLRALWRIGDASRVVDTMAKPQLAQATRQIVGQYDAIAAVSSSREAIRVAILTRLSQTLPPQGLNPVGLTLGGVFADADVQKGWVEQALMTIDPAFSRHKLEEMRINAITGAGTVVVPGNTALHVSLPGATPAGDESV